MSSLGGSSSNGKRPRSASTVSLVSSTDSVVCDSQATRVGSASSSASTAPGPVDEGDVLGRLAGGPDDLLVALVADQQDLEALVGEPPRLVVDLGHQGAGRVDGPQPAAGGLLVHRRRDAVRREDDDGPSGTSSVSSTKTAPRASRVSTTCRLCTICLRT